MKLHPIVYYTIAFMAMIACTSKTSNKQMPLLHLSVTQAYEKELPTRMQFVGQTYSQSDVTIQPRVSGYLLSTHFKSGMPVEKGQLLFKIDSEPMLVELAKANAGFAAAESQLVDAQSNYDRSVPLARIKAISQSSLDQAIAKLASAKANLASAKASLRSANLNLSYTKIYAPMSGVIGGTIPSVGDYVGAGTRSPILNTISNIETITVLIYIPTVKYLSIALRDGKKGPIYQNEDLLTDIEMVLADGEVYPYKGEYDYTEREVNTSTGAVVLHVKFPNPDEFLIPGEYVRVNANVGSAIGAVMVPQRSVIQSQTRNSVFVVGMDSTVQYKAVTLGGTYGSDWEVLEGLMPGEMVITEGLQKVHNGMKILPMVKNNK